MNAIYLKANNALHRIFHGSKRQKITAAAAFFIVYILLLSGIFSYFHSQDSATNRMDGKSGDILLLEPEWDRTGESMAQASEPGMMIPKDPYAMNNGQVDEYIRLRMTVVPRTFVPGNDTYNSNYDDTNDPQLAGRRLNLILDSITMNNGTPSTDDDLPLFDMDTTGEPHTWTITKCNNENYILDIVTDTDGTVCYDFYFTGGDAENMKIVSPGDPTDKLFDYISIPIYKKDYLGVFDQKYDITLVAQGIPASNYPNGLTVHDITDSEDNVITQGAVSAFKAEE